MPPKGKKKAETETPTEAAPPPVRRSSRLAPGAAAANAAPAEEAPAAAAAAASAASKPPAKGKKGKKKAAATEDDVIVLLAPRVRELVPEDIEDDDIQNALHDVLMGLPQPVDYDALQGLEEELQGVVFQAVAILTGPVGEEGEGKVEQEEAPPAAAAAASSPPAAAATPLGTPPPGPFSASVMAAQAAAANGPSPAATAASPAASPAAPLRIVAPPPDMNALLAAAQAAQAARAAPAAAAAPSSSDEEEDSPPAAANAAAPSSAASAAAAAAAAALAPSASDGAVPMSQQAFSVPPSPAPMAASPVAPRGVFNPAAIAGRITAINPAMFSEALGERTNALYPTLGMAPVPWSVLKTAAAARGETYFTFTLAEDSPTSGYTLETGDPEKVAVAGVFNVYKHNGRVVIRVMDMGCRPELVPKAGGVNPWISHAVLSLVNWVVGKAATMVPPVGLDAIVYRHQRKQLMGNNEFVSLLNTYAANRIPISQYTHANPGALPTALKTKGAAAGANAAAITNQFVNPGVEGPDHVSYETRARGSGAVTMIRTSQIAMVRERDPVHGDEDAATIEFVSLAANILNKPDAAAAPRVVTVPDPIVLEDPQSESVFSNPALKLPRRGGRKTTKRTRKTSSRR